MKLALQNSSTVLFELEFEKTDERLEKAAEVGAAASQVERFEKLQLWK